MAYQNLGVVYMVQEASYNAAALDLTAGICRAWNCKMVRNEAEITTENRRTGMAEDVKDIVPGNTGGTVTLTGTLGINDSLLLHAAFLMQNSGQTEFTINTAQASAYYSYSIYNSRPDVGATTYDVAKGCVMESFQITGASGGLVTFTATFRSLAPEKAQTPALTNKPELAKDCLWMGDVTYSGNSNTKPISFDLTIANEFADDSATYANSKVKTLEMVEKTMVTFNTTSVKIAADDTLENAGYILPDLVEATLTLNNSNATPDNWAIVMNLKNMSADTDDNPNKTRIVTHNMRAFIDNDNTLEPITVTVTIA